MLRLVQNNSPVYHLPIQLKAPFHMGNGLLAMVNEGTERVQRMAGDKASCNGEFHSRID